MNSIITLGQWIRRLPALFVYPLIGVLFALFLGLSAFTEIDGFHAVSRIFYRAMSSTRGTSYIWSLPFPQVFLTSLIVLLTTIFALILAYNIAALFHRWVRTKPDAIPATPVTPPKGGGKRLDAYPRIGIILSGGGAKGAYQAGAMKAIYEFLEQNGALGNVTMIAGTSIGSWNAMFWLADLIKPSPDGKPGALESWWRKINIGNVIEFDSYFPFLKNSVLLPTPWKESFQQIFSDNPPVKDHLSRLFEPGADAPHFYFTRANVEQGTLCFATNNATISANVAPNHGKRDTIKNPSVKIAKDSYELIEKENPDKFAHLERAVFASMDLPPMFPYASIRKDREEWFEDGGVVDNLPVWFGTDVENCDLLFILPLNSSFAEDVDHTSLSERMFRVMDVRQGVLERNSLKLTYLYNELAALRDEINRLNPDGLGESGLKSSRAKLVDRALQRDGKALAVFAICPQKPLLIDTAAFWHTKQAGDAFDVMYAATKKELEENFENDSDPSWIRMTLVDRLGGRSHLDDY